MTDTNAEGVKKVRDILVAQGAREVYVFGAAARGDPMPSDLDLAVRGLPPERFFRAVYLAGAAIECSVDIVDLDEPSPFTRHLESEGLLRRVG